MYEEEVVKTFSAILKVNHTQNVVICILVGAVIVLFALHLINTHYRDKRIAVLEEEMIKLVKAKDE